MCTGMHIEYKRVSCVCIHMDVCVCVCAQVAVSVCTHVHIHAHTCLCECVMWEREHVCLGMYTYVHGCGEMQHHSTSPSNAATHSADFEHIKRVTFQTQSLV